ncbi:MAG TPA: cytochrome c [Steroidobacteraceae bacterium]|nr:cytochrome c [Steroidobacteraceae bacterium]
MFVSRSRAVIGVALAAAICGTSLGGIALAQTPPPAGAPPVGPTTAERAIEYRQSVFKIVAGNFGPLSQVAQGKAEFKAEPATRQALRLSQIATFIGDAVPDVSKEGKTRALPAIWSNRKEFDQIAADFVTHTKTLAEVAENSSSAGEEFKAAVAAVGNDCKSCHEKFRSK